MHKYKLLSKKGEGTFSEVGGFFPGRTRERSQRYLRRPADPTLLAHEQLNAIDQENPSRSGITRSIRNRSDVLGGGLLREGGGTLAGGLGCAHRLLRKGGGGRVCCPRRGRERSQRYAVQEGAGREPVLVCECLFAVAKDTPLSTTGLVRTSHDLNISGNFQVLKSQSIKTGRYVAIKCMKNRFESIDQVNNLREIQVGFSAILFLLLLDIYFLPLLLVACCSMRNLLLSIAVVICSIGKIPSDFSVFPSRPSVDCRGIRTSSRSTRCCMMSLRED